MANPFELKLHIGTLASALLLGCSSSLGPPPSDQWAVAQARLGQAQASGATTVPDANLHLRLAQEELATARTVMDRDNRRASTLLVLAAADAQLSLSLARQARAQDDAKVAQSELHMAEGK